MDGLYTLCEAIELMKTDAVTARVVRAQEAVNISLTSEKTNCYVNIDAYKLMKTGDLYFKVNFKYLKNNNIDTFWVTEQQCLNKTVSNLIVYYKKINRLE